MKKFSRRKFLAVSGATTGAAWFSLSGLSAPRYVRDCIADLTEPILRPKQKPDPKTWSDNALTATWLGHATVLINFYGFNILTDPILFNRVGVDIGLGSVGPKRRYAAPLAPSELPRIDLVLLSHAHLDHFDIPSLRHFQAGTKAVTAKNTSDLLKGTALGKNTTELKWDEKTLIRSENGEAEVQAFQVKHWGARWRHDTHRGFNGYVVKREGKQIIFGGDTAMTDSFSKLRSQQPFELACMPIGAYDPWIWSHCNPEQAVQMANEAGAKAILPMHHTTFRLGRELFTEPLDRLKTALKGEPDRLALSDAGETFMAAA